MKFELLKKSTEIKYRDRKKIEQGIVFSDYDADEEVISSFDKLEDAMDALGAFYTTVKALSGNTGQYFYITEYFVEANERDDDGNIVESDGVEAISEMPQLDGFI